MQIHVEISSLNSELENQLALAIEENWHRRVMIVPPTQQLPENALGLLVIGEPTADLSSESLLIRDRVATEGSDLSQILFEVNAKLERMVRSDLAKSSYTSLLSDTKLGVSRRNMLLSVTRRFQSYSDAPVVFGASCEAKYGCAKCVYACPSNAVKFGEGSVTVSASDCTRCGLCTAVCPVSAIQMPRFSEDAFLGLIDGINKSEAPKKTLVLTCDRSKVRHEPWMCVEHVNDVGIVGQRQLAIAASSSLGAIIVLCADGKCLGKDNAKQSVNRIKSVMAEGGPQVEYLEGREATDRIEQIHSLSTSRKPTSHRITAWENYTSSLNSIAASGSPANQLGLIEMTVGESCTLCEGCAKTCPHGSLEIMSGELLFDSSTCTGCGNCVFVCPENSIALSTMRTFSPTGQKVVYKDEIVPCASCGKPLDSLKLMKKIAVLVGKDDPMMKYCADCKQKLVYKSLFEKNARPPNN